MKVGQWKDRDETDRERESEKERGRWRAIEKDPGGLKDVANSFSLSCLIMY